MPRQKASTLATGGGGYTFADRVAAAFLAQMLKRIPPFDADLGPIVALHFETRESDQVLDDLRLILRRGSAESRCAVSVKIAAHLGPHGFTKEFVADAWEHTQQPNFDFTSDLLVLVVGAINDRALQEWRKIETQASNTTPERLAERLGTQQSSATQKRIFESLRGLNGAKRDLIETARLASRIRVVPFSDERARVALTLCAELVRDGIAAEGTKLWDRLQRLASDSRAPGAFFDIPTLLRALRPEFELLNFPDLEADWSRLDDLTRGNINAVRSVIGTDRRIPRDDVIATLAETCKAASVVAVVGESGTGKSAAVAQFVSGAGRFHRLVWLTSEQLSRGSQAEAMVALGLRHSIPNLIELSAVKNCVLVIDGFEQFQGSAHRRAIELIETLRSEGFTGWKVIVTCQTHSWEQVQDSLVSTGAADVHRLDFRVPSLEQVLGAVGEHPHLRLLLLRHDLQPILQNLVLLDWVVRANVAERLSSRPWVGETDVIGYVWERWMGDGPQRYARDLLLRTLAEREGEQLSGAAHRDAVRPEQLPLLAELADEGMVHVSGPSVRFSHDLLGDWGRFRALVFAGADAVPRIMALAPVPRWGRAIRLYAQSLAEQGSGLASWKSASDQLSATDAQTQLARDLFLDGMLLATNSEALLEQVWTDLLEDRGQVIRRLLKRLLHVATLPDWRIALFRSKDVADDHLGAWFRIPVPIYWYPLLRVLSKHHTDVVHNALYYAAEVCGLWLRTMPPGTMGRREAAAVALALGREMQALLVQDTYFKDSTKHIFEAALLAAHEFPDEVGHMALELAGRRPQPQHAVDRRRQWREQQAALQADWIKKNPESARRPPPPGTFLPLGGRMRPPAEDGPTRRVPDDFQAAVLDGAALQPLIATNPAVAREVLLAVCIEEPRREDPYNDRMFLIGRCGLEDWRHGYPAMYWKGPFLAFLRAQPKAGIEAVVRLVNHATSRWLEAAAGPDASEERRSRFGLEFTFGDRTVVWSGDANVFGWHRTSSLHCSTVECALMALEKWLYDELDAKREIGDWVQVVFQDARSLAFAGVLIAVGMRHPQLFASDLLPLLGNFYIFRTQLSLAQHESAEMWRSELAHFGEQLAPMAVEWHRLPHRRYVLQDLVQRVMLYHDELQRYLSERARTTWAALLEHPGVDRDSVELMLARFEPANYTTTPKPDGTLLIEWTLPAELSARLATRQEGTSIKLLSVSLAPRARRLLRDQDVLATADLDAFAADVQRLGNWQPTDLDRAEQQYRINSIAGGIAVLVIKHRTWLSEHPAIEDWCFEVAQTLTAIVDGGDDSPMSLLENNAEAFLGELGVALLAERQDTWVARLAFSGVTGYFYSSTWHTMWVACDRRVSLGNRFDELINVLAFWSALRLAAMRESRHLDDHLALTRYREALYRRYARGRLRGPLTQLKAVETLGRRLVRRVDRARMSPERRRVAEAREAWAAEHPDERKRSRDIPDVDLDVLARGFGFLPAMMRDSIPEDEPRKTRYVDEMFELEMRTFLPATAAGHEVEIDGTPYFFDGWLIQIVAEFVAHARSRETARRYYQPILALGPQARYWVDDFLHGWVRVGLTVTTDRQMYVAIWQDMVDFTLAQPHWRPRVPGYWSSAESLATDLMGLDRDSAAILGRREFTEVVEAMAPAFQRWAAVWLTQATAAAGFAHFLATESGSVLLASGIPALAAVVSSFRKDDWDHQGLGLLITEALASCWTKLRSRVEQDQELREPFLKLLTELSVRQVPEALHLRDRVSTLFGSS